MKCLPHGPKFLDFFDLCLHWVSVVRGPNLLPFPFLGAVPSRCKSVVQCKKIPRKATAWSREIVQSGGTQDIANKLSFI